MTSPLLATSPDPVAGVDLRPRDETPPLLAPQPGSLPTRNASETGAWPFAPQTSLWPLAPSPPLSPHLIMEVADWDALYEAVEDRLRAAVGEQLGVLPNIPGHAAALAASLVQAIVLDCVSALDQLHEALKQERDQRTPH